MQTSYQCWCQTGLQHGPHCSLRASTGHSVLPNWWAENLITKYEMAIISRKQVTTAIKHNTSCIVRIATEIEQTSEYHWYGAFMRYAPSANGILHLILHPVIVVLLCCILLVLLVIYFYICLSHISLCWKYESPIVTWFGLECPNLPLRKTRGLTVPPLTWLWFFTEFGLWQGTRVIVHSALVLAQYTDDATPQQWLYCHNHWGTERATCKLESLWAGEFVT